MATEELIINAKWHDQGFSVGAKRAQRDLAVVNRNASAFNATLGVLGATLGRIGPQPLSKRAGVDPAEDAHAIKEVEVRRINLIFNADASQVQDASDLAAFSLGLVVDQLRNINPAAGSALQGLHQIVLGIQSLNYSQTIGLSVAAASAAKFGGIAGIIAGGIGLVTSLFGRGKSAAEKYAEQQRKAEEATRAHARTLEEFTREVENLTYANIVEQINTLRKKQGGILDSSIGAVSGGNAHIPGILTETRWTPRDEERLNILLRQLGRFTGEVNTVAEAFEEYQYRVKINHITDPVQKVIAFITQLNKLDKINIDTTVNSEDTNALFNKIKSGNASERDLKVALTETTFREQRRIIEHLTALEIEIRKKEADAVIAAIERQRETVLRAIDDAEQAQRTALERAIGLQFDFAEAELRARYQPLFAGAGGDQAQLTLLRESAERDIETLRSTEADTLTDALQNLSSQFDARRETTNNLFDGMIEATHKATQDLSNSFDNSLRTHLSTFLGNFDASVDAPEIAMSADTARVLNDALGPTSALADINANGIKFEGLLDEEGDPITIKVDPIVLPEINLPKIEFSGIKNPDTNEDYQIRFTGILDEDGKPIAIGPSQALIDLIDGGIKGNIAVSMQNSDGQHGTLVKNNQTIEKNIQDMRDVLTSPDIKGQAGHYRSVRLLLQSINHQLGGPGYRDLKGRLETFNEEVRPEQGPFPTAGDPNIFNEDAIVEEYGQSTERRGWLSGYPEFKSDIEKIRNQITSSGTALEQISTAIPKTENIEGKLDSVVTELKNLEKPSYTIGDIHIHIEKIDEESAEEIATEIRDRIITEFGENTELRNARYPYVGAEDLT